MVALTLALRRGPQGFILRDWSVSCGCSGPGLGSLASEVFTVGVGLWIHQRQCQFLFVFRFASKSFGMFADPGEASVPTGTSSDQPADRTSDVPEA